MQNFQPLRWIALALILFCASGIPHARAADDTRPGLAILYFDYTGQNASLGVLKKGLTGMLIKDVQPGSPSVKVVERDRLEEIIKELEFSQSDKVDSATAAKIGKLIGARYLVVGDFFDLFGTLVINARLVKVETGEILGAVGANGSQDDFLALKESLVGDLVEAINGLPVEASGQGAAPAKKPPTKSAKPKPKVSTATVMTYSKALDAKDKGDTATAKKLIAEVKAKSPDPAFINLLGGDLNFKVQ